MNTFMSLQFHNDVFFRMQNDSKDQVFQAVKRYEPNSKKARKNLAGAASIGSSAGDAFEKVKIHILGFIFSRRFMK